MANVCYWKVLQMSSLLCFSGLQMDMEVLKHAAERHKEAVVEKEREVARKVQSARDEEIYKSAVLHQEK